CKVFLMTLKTGGLGLNLTAADTVFIYDPWWNIAAENQAIDRSHRIGQDRTVFSYKLITKGTIEEKIVKLQEQKRTLFENIISSDSTAPKFLDVEDINFLLSADDT
ncbi:MAG: SWF/SNF helicase family protein, partial [SAR324 cluster bacterium]|nr:SWF/SNF helicase family protein [SAR324 cluster bacterium]